MMDPSSGAAPLSEPEIPLRPPGEGSHPPRGVLG